MVHCIIVKFTCSYKPSDEVVTVVLTLDSEMPAEFSHLTLKEYCFPGLKSLTVSSEGGEVEVAVLTVNSFPLSERYVTMYLNEPTEELRHPLNLSLTDRAVLPSIDTLGLDGAVCENVKCNKNPKW